MPRKGDLLPSTLSFKKGLFDNLGFTKVTIDPVNAPAVQVPDYNASVTTAQKLVDTFTLKGTGTGGGAYAVIVPTLNGGFYTAPTVEPTGGASVTSLGAASSSDWYSSLSVDVYEYRIVSYNVTVTNIASDAGSSGILCINSYAGTTPATPVNLKDLFNDDGVRTAAKHGASFNAKPFTSPLFVAMSLPCNTYLPLCVVAATGLPLTDSLLVTVTWNVELVFNGSTLGRTNSTASPCNPVDCCVAANCHSRETTFAAGPNPYDKLVSAGLRMAKSALASYLKMHAGS